MTIPEHYHDSVSIGMTNPDRLYRVVMHNELLGYMPSPAFAIPFPFRGGGPLIHSPHSLHCISAQHARLIFREKLQAGITNQERTMQNARRTNKQRTTNNNATTHHAPRTTQHATAKVRTFQVTRLFFAVQKKVIVLLIASETHQIESKQPKLKSGASVYVDMRTARI